jgi:hypothetical protein
LSIIFCFSKLQLSRYIFQIAPCLEYIPHCQEYNSKLYIVWVQFPNFTLSKVQFAILPNYTLSRVTFVIVFFTLEEWQTVMCDLEEWPNFPECTFSRVHLPYCTLSRALPLSLPFFQVHFVRSAICHSFNCTLSGVQFAILSIAHCQ